MDSSGKAALLLLREAFEQAMHNLRTHTERAALTGAGITIAIAALIVTVGLSQGLQASIAQRLGHLASQITITPQTSRINSGSRTAQPLNNTDATALSEAKHTPGIATVTPLVTTTAIIQTATTHVSAEITGSTVDYLDTANRTLEAGHNFTPADYAHGDRTVVLGPNLVNTLFAGNPQAAIGQHIRIEQTSFSVIGALRPDGQHDTIALIPISTAHTVLTGHSSRLDQIIVTATSTAAIDTAIHQTQQIMAKRHHVTETAQSDFSITEQGTLLSSLIRFNRNLELFALFMATVTLGLGAIGLANILLVSVSERTNEIGLRRAIGATRGMITTQFLLEAAVLSGAGGLNGVLAGLVVTLGASKLLPLAAPDYGTPQVSWIAVLIGFALSIITGLIAGLVPARRANQLQPIEALQR